MKAKFLALVALVLGLAACQNDFDGANAGKRGEVDFTLSVAVPEMATRAAGDDSAEGGLTNIDLENVWDIRYILEVYDANGELAKERMYAFEDSASQTAFNLRLVPGRPYTFVVWADFVPQAATRDLAENYDHHYNTTAGLTKVMVVENSWTAIDESRDAYTGRLYVEDFRSTSTINVTLTRPFAKLRVITTDIKELYGNLMPETVKVNYINTAFYNEFNALAQDVVGEPAVAGEKVVNLETMTYTNEEPKKDGKMTLFADYFFRATDDRVMFTMDVQDNTKQDIPTVVFNTNIPVQRNYLTTVMGPVLTDSNNITVTIDDAFAGYNNVESGIENELLTAAKQKEYIINLSGDFTWNTGASHGSTPFIPADAITEKLTINGNGNKIIATGAGVGPIRMANGGKLIFNDVVFVDNTVSYAENNWEFLYLEFADNLEFNNCKFYGNIAVEDEDNSNDDVITFTNCEFLNTSYPDATKTDEYATWISDGNVTFTNCKFSGNRGIKVHEQYGVDVTMVVVDKCEFNSLAKKPGMAIGDVDASTTITIKNSLFIDCQPGDQGLYIYESDTDVTTFNFTNEKNVVATTATKADGVNVVKDADGNEYIYTLTNANGMFWFANEVNANNKNFTGKTVKLGADIDLENADWEPIGQTGATTFNGIFDGQNYTISNLNVDSEAETGANYSSGLFGWVESHTANRGHIKNVKINGATIKGNHNCGALVGYITQQTALVENCHVTGATISCKVANAEANGDKAGALIGNATVATPVKNCSATDSTVSSGRDAGQVIGAAKEANVTGCSATNVTVTANGTGTGANIRNEVIGRLLQ